MAAKNTTYNHERERTKRKTNDGRPWLTENGRGEGCRTCQTQIDVRHALGDDGRYVTLCDGCRAVCFDEGER